MLDLEQFGQAMGLAIKQAVEPLHKQIAELTDKLAKMPVPKDGRDGNDGKDGQDGKNGIDGIDGIGLAGAFIDAQKGLVVTLSNGEVKALGRVVGDDGTNGKDGGDGTDGKDGISLESFELEYLPETHEISIKAAAAGRVKELKYPAGGISMGGYWREGTHAKAGEAWVEAGSMWVATKETKSKPCTTSADWVIAARKGRDAEIPRAKALPPAQSIKLGAGA